MGWKLVKSLIPFAVVAAEKVVGRKKGETKMETALEIVTALSKAAVGNGTDIVPTEQMKSEIQAVVDMLNAQGKLAGADTPLTLDDAGVQVEGVRLILTGMQTLLAARK